MSSFSTSLRPCSSAGTLSGSCRCWQNINRHGFLSRLHPKQVNKSSRGQQRAAILLYEQDNHINDAGFPRSDGRLVVWACFGSCPFSPGSQALFSVLWTFVGHFDSCSFALSSETLFTLLVEFVEPFDEVSRHFCATLTKTCAKTVPLKTIPITYRHRPDKQSPTSNARPCATRSSAPVSPRHHRTTKVRPRMLGTARLARTRVPQFLRRAVLLSIANYIFAFLSVIHPIIRIFLWPDSIAIVIWQKKLQTLPCTLQ